MPNLRGYGQLPDLWVAMTLDPVLKEMVQGLMASDHEKFSYTNVSYTKRTSCADKGMSANDNPSSEAGALAA